MSTKLELVVPSKAEPSRLDLFLRANLHGVSRKRIKALINAGQVFVDGRPERKAGRALSPEQVVGLAIRPSRLRDETPFTTDLVVAAGEGWWVVNKPPGVSSHRTDAHDRSALPERLASALGRPPSEILPVHRLDADTSGLLLLASPSTIGPLSSRFEQRSVDKAYLAVVSPGPAGNEGELSSDDGRMHLRFWVVRRSADGTRAELRVEPTEGRTHQIRKQLAGAGIPVVGDLLYGRPLPGGAPRMALHCARLAWAEHRVEVDPGRGWEALLEPPTKPVAPGHSKSPQTREGDRSATPPRSVRQTGAPNAQPTPKRGGPRRRQLRVSGATARIVAAGHPWIIADTRTGSLSGVGVGELVDLTDPKGHWIATAAADPSRELCARVVSRREGESLDDDTWAGRTAKALARRTELLTDPETTACRLIHGEADHLPGLFVDLWGEVMVATRTSRCADGYRPVVYESLRQSFPECPLYERDHLSDLRSRSRSDEGETLPGRWIHGTYASERLVVRERGLAFAVTPFGGLTTGFYPDQRRNRARLTAHEATDGGVAANLFGHTAAFSVALASAGAREAITVDLAPAYAKWACENLRANGLDPTDHPVVTGDAASWLRRRRDPLDVIVIDPPAFARARRRSGRGWNARRDYRALVEVALGCLRSGGLLLCCHNLRSVKRGWLRNQVEAAAQGAGVALREVCDAPPAFDFPRLRGFPEGTSFRGLMATIG